MKIKKTRGYIDKLERVKGTTCGVWDNCVECGARIPIIEGYEGRCVCKKCKQPWEKKDGQK